MKALLTVILSMFVIQMSAQDFRFDESLVASYPFNGNANDESLYGNHGTVVDAELVADRYGNMNSAYWFNGATSFIIVPDNASLDITSDISIAGWMKKNSDVPWASMVTKGGDSGALEENNYTIHNSDVNSVIFTSSLPNTSNGSIAIPLNEWHFITFVRQGTSGKFYIDGISDDVSQNIFEGDFTTNTSSLYIGLDLPGSTEYFHGCLDDIKIFNRALTAEEITLLFSGTFTSIDQNKATCKDSFTIWPNPVSANSGFFVDCHDHVPDEFSLLDDVGNTVFKETRMQDPNYFIDLKRLKLSAGNYFTVVKKNNSFMSKTIIIKN